MSEALHLFCTENHFKDGCFENITLGAHGLMLERDDDVYIQRGCFTSDEIAAEKFSALAAAWSCDTPLGTCAELEVSVKYCAEDGGEAEKDGVWSEFYSFGKWSPFIMRGEGSCFCADADNNAARFDGSLLHFSEKACAFKIKINLYSDAGEASPCVRGIFISVKHTKQNAQDGAPLTRSARVPAYSQLIRDPKIANEISLSVCCAMLVNRWGEDVLPEELAHISYDYAQKSYDNLSYAAAALGCLGYKAYISCTDAAALKKEIKDGYACAVRVLCTADENNRDYAFSPALAGPKPAHTVVLYGFEESESGEEYALINNPYSFTDEGARRSVPLNEFKRAWTGAALFVHEKGNVDTLAAPQRQTATLSPAEIPNEWALYVQGERKSLPPDFCDNGTVCYALREERAFATTAHRRFYYTNVSESGNIVIDTSEMHADTRLTMFAINGTGTVYAAELKI